MNEELIFRLRATAEGLEQSARAAKDELNKLGKAYSDSDESAKKAKDSTDNLKKSQHEQTEASRRQNEAQRETTEGLVQLAAVTATATIAFRTLMSTIKTGTEAYKQYVNAMSGLQSIAEGVGADMAVISRETSKLIEDGLMTIADASGAMKNLLLYGYSAEQAAKMLERLKDAAAYNRKEHYSLGEAVKATTEGIRMENSMLSDAAGVTKNIAKMFEDYAAQLGKSTTALTKAEKAQAIYNGIMEETEVKVGDAAIYAEQFAGTQARLEASTLRLKQAYGDAVSGGLTPFIQALTGGTDVVTDLIENNRVLVSVLTTLLTAATGLIAVVGVKTALIKLLGLTAVGTAGGVGVLTKALAAMWVAAGPAGWIIAGIAAVAAVIAGVSAAAEEAKKRAEELRKEIESLADANRGAEKLVAEYEQLSQKTVKTAQDTQRMLDIRAELVESYGFSVDAVDAEGRLLAGNLDIMKEQLAIQKEMLLDKLKANQVNEEKLYNDALKKREGLLKNIAIYEDNIAKLSEKGWSTDLGNVDMKDLLETSLKDLADGQKAAEEAIRNMISAMITEIELRGPQIPAAVKTTIVQQTKDALIDGLTYDEVMGTAQGIIDRYLQLDSAVVESKISQFASLRDELIAIFATPEVDPDTATAFIDTLINALIGTQAQEEAFARMEELKQRIVAGLATIDEMSEYNDLIAGFQRDVTDAMNTLTAAQQQNISGAEPKCPPMSRHKFQINPNTSFHQAA